MRKFVFISVTLAVCLSVHVATTQENEYIYYFKNGNDLVEAMREFEKSETDETKIWAADGVYMGYVQGVRDSFADQLYFGENVTVGQACAIVAKYLKEHPEEWHKRAALLVYQALLEAFPKEE